MVVPAVPAATGELVEADFVFEVPVVFLDGPSSLGQLDESKDRCLGGLNHFRQSCEGVTRKAAKTPRRVAPVPFCRRTVRHASVGNDRATSATDSLPEILPLARPQKAVHIPKDRAPLVPA